MHQRLWLRSEPCFHERLCLYLDQRLLLHQRLRSRKHSRPDEDVDFTGRHLTREMKSLINRKHAQVDFEIGERLAWILYLTGLYDETVTLEKENEISSIGGSFTDNANQLHGQSHRRERRELRRAHGAAGTLEAIIRRRVAKTAGSAQ